MVLESHFCIFVHEKVLISDPKLEKEYNEKQHFIILGMLFCFLLEASGYCIEIGNFLNSAVSDCIVNKFFHPSSIFSIADAEQLEAVTSESLYTVNGQSPAKLWH